VVHYCSALYKSIEDAEEELGFPRGWTDIGDPSTLEYRWQLLRDRAADSCGINDIFARYLGKTTPAPERLSPYLPRHPEPESQRTGWISVPHEFDTGDPDEDIKTYIASLRGTEKPEA
jgi:hypothetical protein